jgi:hypothetical protein
MSGWFPRKQVLENRTFVILAFILVLASSFDQHGLPSFDQVFLTTACLAIFDIPLI